MSGMLNGVRSVVDSCLTLWSSWTRADMARYCDLLTVDDSLTMVTGDGSLLSMIRIEGSRVMIGKDEYLATCEAIADLLKAHQHSAGHPLQWVFGRSDENLDSAIAAMYEPSVSAAKRIGLDMSDINNERISRMSDLCRTEFNVLAFWTTPQALPPHERAEAEKSRMKWLKGQKPLNIQEAQQPGMVMEALRILHSSLRDTILTELNNLDIMAEAMEADAMLRLARQCVAPDTTPTHWRPNIPGSVPLRRVVREVAPGEISGAVWPALGRQVMISDSERIGNARSATVRIGHRLYGTVVMSLGPETELPFQELFRHLGRDVPYRISFRVLGNASDLISIKGFWASLLAITNRQTSLLHRNLKEMGEYLAEGGHAVRLQMAITTWTNNSENGRDELERRLAHLGRCIQEWGVCAAREERGDPTQAACETVPGLNQNAYTAPQALPPTRRAAMLLPHGRPAAAYNTGSVVFRTADGKPWPWSPGASDQLTSIDIFYGGPGSGKSALQNTINLALVTDPRNEFIPRITNIDIGPSATGFIDEMRAALGADREHLAIYARLQNTPEYAINILEPALLGCSRLLPTERDAATNFVTLLVTPLGERSPHSEIGALVVRAIDATFDYFTRLEPRSYTRGRDQLVDAAIFKHKLAIDDQTTWWEIRDDLFAAGATREALRAQSFAVPLVPDLVSAVRNDPSISSVYGRVPAHSAGGESLLDYFCRRLTDACAMFPILTEPTRFETGEARLIVLDLDAVAKGTGAMAQRQIGVMYNLAMKAGVAHLYINKDDVAYVDEPYRGYQAKRINALRNEANMRVCFGEFHRMGGQDACLAQVMLYAREGRKWGVQLAMDSQLLTDYPEDLITLATNVFIMEGGDAERIRAVGTRFGLNSTAMDAMRRLRGPTERGAPFLLYMKTKAATYSLLLYSSPGPRELWLHSTTPTDAAIRNWLYEEAIRQGKDRRWARNILAIAYPNGSAKREYEALAARRHDLATDEDGVGSELIEIMATNAIKRVDNHQRII